MSDVTPQSELLPQARPVGVTFTFAADRPLRSVAVAGTFNSWRGDWSPLRQISAGCWQSTLPISPGRHLYKYVLDGEEWVRDPTNPWVSEDGQGNSCFTLTEAGELYVRRGEFGPTHPGPLFRDHAATPSPEWLRDAVIYELSARAVGGLRGVRERLPYLRELGVTALWLMPVQPVGLQHRSGSLGDPYAVRDFLAVDPALGTPDDLRALVDEAHAQGLRVILDWTLNRGSIDSPLTEQHPEWFQRDASGRVTYHVPGRPAFAGFDFAQRGLRRYLIDAMLQWVTRYDLDGLRFDDSDLVPLDALREIRLALLAARPELALISQSYDELHHLGACDLTYEGGVRELIRQIARGEAEPLALQRYWEEATYSFPRGALRLRWLEEKEQGRAWRSYGRALHAAAASLLLTLDGVPMLLMGQEFEEPNWQSWETLFEPFALGRPSALPSSPTTGRCSGYEPATRRCAAARCSLCRLGPTGSCATGGCWGRSGSAFPSTSRTSGARRPSTQRPSSCCTATGPCRPSTAPCRHSGPSSSVSNGHHPVLRRPNTWGCPPVEPGQAAERYGPDVRWGGVLRTVLGPGYWVLEEGLGGRTTVRDDPVEGEHKNGKRYLLPCLESHAPLDLVALMLGTNDLKRRFELSAAEIAAGAGALVDIVLASACGPQNRAPNVLLICPPPTAQLSGFAELFAGAGEKSLTLAAHYRREAALRGCAFLDAGQIIVSSERDGIHFEVEAHQTLGRAVARIVEELLGV